MEKANFQLNITKKEAPRFRFQETCIKLAELSGLPNGVLFALWKRVGPEIYQIEAEIKAGEVKNVKAYILWKLKKNNGQHQQPNVPISQNNGYRGFKANTHEKRYNQAW